MTELYLRLLRSFWRILAEPRLVAVVRQIKWWQYCLLACIQWEFNSQLRNSRQERSVFDWLLIIFLSRWRVRVYHDAFIMNISQIFYYIPSHYSVLCPFKYYPDANRKQCSYIIKYIENYVYSNIILFACWLESRQPISAQILLANQNALETMAGSLNFKIIHFYQIKTRLNHNIMVYFHV